MKFLRLSSLFSVFAILILLNGCGGSGSNPAPTVSGVAAAGAPISGSVYLKDSANPAKELSIPVAADGSFSFDVSGLAAPFLLKAAGTAGGKSYTLYSFAAGAGVANINPLSHLAVAEANGSDDLATLYANPNPAAMQTIKTGMASVIARIRTALQGTLAPFGAGAVDFIADPYLANHQGLDLLFDLMSISVANGTVTITDKTHNNSSSAPLNNFLTDSVTFIMSIPPMIAGNVCVLPVAPSVVANGTVNFKAIVIGSTIQQVAWSVVESGGGTITGDGIYTAPATAGTYHVQATNTAATPNRWTRIAVTVTSGRNSGGGGNATSGTPATVAVIAGSATSNIAPADGTGTAAVFWGGGHLALDSSGNIIVSDRGTLRKVTPAGIVTTLIPGYSPVDWEGIAIDGAGNIFGSGGSSQLVSLSPVNWGASVNEMTVTGTISNISTNWETSTTYSAVGWGGLAVDSSGGLYLADGINNRIVKFTSTGAMSVFAGSGICGSDDGVGTLATFNNPTDLAIDAKGNLYVNGSGGSIQRNSGTSTIRKITPDGTVSTVAQLQSLQGPIAVDASGNIYTVVIPQTIVRIDPLGNMTTFSVPGIIDFVTALVADGNGNLYAGTRGIGAQILKISF